MRKISLMCLIITAVVLWIAVPIFAADKPTPENPIDWQELALQYKAQLEITETKRLVAEEIGQACEDRMGTLIAQGRQRITKPAVKAWRDYMAKKRKIKEDADAAEAAKAGAVKPAEKEKVESAPDPEPAKE